jgi:hypothetical protein
MSLTSRSAFLSGCKCTSTWRPGDAVAAQTTFTDNLAATRRYVSLHVTDVRELRIAGSSHERSVSGAYGEPVDFPVRPNVSVWKGSYYTGHAGVVASGDDVFAKLELDSSATFSATTIIVNLVNAYGLVVNATPAGLDVLHVDRRHFKHGKSSKPIHVDMMPDTVLDGELRPDSLAQTRLGSLVQIIGVRSASGVAASRIFFLNLYH